MAEEEKKENELVKIYYDKATGYLCNRYPKDIQVADDTPFIEVSEEEAAQTYVVEGGKFWAVKDGKLQIVDDLETLNSSEYQYRKLQQQIDIDKSYLNSTDYVVLKIAEAQAEGDTDAVASLKKEYKDVLAKRATIRVSINDKQAQEAKMLSSIQNASNSSESTATNPSMLSIR